LLHRAAHSHDEVNIPSPALLGHNRDRLVADVDRSVADTNVPVVGFKRGEVKS
jgi:hypothetical protein